MPLDSSNPLPSGLQRLTVAQDPAALTTGDDQSRTRTFVLSDSSVARDGHTLATNGWDTSAYARNPVVLWAHDGDSLPVARMVRTYVQGDKLMGDMEFASADLNPMAETVFQMVRQGFLSAVSVGFIPLDGKPAKGRGKGAFDFTRQELLEVSVVPVPALTTALVTARKAGIDDSPLLEWARHYVQTSTTPPEQEPTMSRKLVLKRDLWDLAWLAMTLNDLGYLTDAAFVEKAQEGDDSQVPAQLLTALHQLGAALTAMAAEEVAELLASLSPEESPEATARALAVRALIADKSTQIGIMTALNAAARGCDVSITTTETVGQISRKGRVLNKDNEAHLRHAHDCLTRAADHVKTVIDTVSGDETNGDDQTSDDPDAQSNDAESNDDGVTSDDDQARAHRLRKAKARKYQSI